MHQENKLEEYEKDNFETLDKCWLFQPCEIPWWNPVRVFGEHGTMVISLIMAIVAFIILAQ